MGKILFLIGAIAIIALGLFIYKPQLAGNVAKEISKTDLTSCKDNLQIVQNSLSALEKELETCSKAKDSAIADMKKLQATEKCDTTELNNLQTKYNDLVKQKNSLLKNLKDAQDRAKECLGGNDYFSQLNESFSELAKNSANNICCKQRVDNPNIKAYSIDGNKINCLESGDLSLNCP
jgi:hypothetical protein